MRYYYIYKITNLVNGKIYIGKRTTKNKPENDSKYLGSGPLILRAINKYGIENFTKEILEKCTFATLNEREKYYIELYNSRDINIGYNIIEGGYGVGDLCHDRKTYYNPETDEEIRIKETEQPPKGFIHGRRPFLEESKLKMARHGKDNGMYGVHRFGKDNPFYGKTFIINPETLDKKTWFKNDPLPEGYMFCKDFKELFKQEKQKQKELKLQLNRQIKLQEKLNKQQEKEFERLQKEKQSLEKLVSEYKNLKNENNLTQTQIRKSMSNQQDLMKLKQQWAEQRREFWKNKEMEICPYCGKQGRGVGFYKWHMENCSQHPTLGEQNKLKHQQWQNKGAKDLHKNRTEGTTLNKICINNGEHNKFIYKEDLNKYPGYKIGMIKKK